jgi:hypothetical protein
VEKPAMFQSFHRFQPNWETVRGGGEGKGEMTVQERVAKACTRERGKRRMLLSHLFSLNSTTLQRYFAACLDAGL